MSTTSHATPGEFSPHSGHATGCLHQLASDHPDSGVRAAAVRGLASILAVAMVGGHAEEAATISRAALTVAATLIGADENAAAVAAACETARVVLEQLESVGGPAQLGPLLAIPTPRNCFWGPRNIHYGNFL